MRCWKLISKIKYHIFPHSDFSSAVNFVKYGTANEPITSCNGCISMIGAQYDARFGFPSKIVLINGKPNANVLCAPQNVAATASPGELFRIFDLNMLNNVKREPICSKGSIIRRTMALLKSMPRPLVKALQKAFQTMPRSTI